MTENNEMSLVESSPELSDLMIDWLALSDGLHDSWADWMPFLVFGVPYAQIARIFDIDKSTVTNAIKLNPDFARRVAQGRKMVKRQLHYVWLDQKAVKAWKNIDFYLEVDPLEKKENGRYVYDASTRRMLMSEKAKMTRFVLQQLGLHVQRHEVLHHTPQPMFLGDETLAEHVIERVKELVTEEDERDIRAIAAEYRVIKGDGDDAIPFEPTEEEKELEAPYERKHSAHYYENE